MMIFIATYAMCFGLGNYDYICAANREAKPGYSSHKIPTWIASVYKDNKKRKCEVYHMSKHD